MSSSVQLSEEYFLSDGQLYPNNRIHHNWFFIFPIEKYDDGFGVVNLTAIKHICFVYWHIFSKFLQ